MTITKRTVAGWALAGLGLGILLGDIGARMLGWDGPNTLQIVSAVAAAAGAWLVEAERRAARREGE
jgi:hypothetical protein